MLRSRDFMQVRVISILLHISCYMNIPKYSKLFKYKLSGKRLSGKVIVRERSCLGNVLSGKRLSGKVILRETSVTPPHHHTTTVLRPLIRDHPGEPVPEENFWTLWFKGRLTEADTPTIRLGASPSGLTSAVPTSTIPFFYRPDAVPAGQPTVSKH